MVLRINDNIRSCIRTRGACSCTDQIILISIYPLMPPAVDGNPPVYSLTGDIDCQAFENNGNDGAAGNGLGTHIDVGIGVKQVRSP